MQGGSKQHDTTVDSVVDGGVEAADLQAQNTAALAELNMSYSASGNRHLHVFPELLEFPMRLGVDTLLTASLRNNSPSFIAFKVKTTATERYRVRPNLGVVAPGETAHVKLVLVAQSDFTPDLQHCRDRFLVQSLPILPGQQPDTNAFKREKFKVQDHKLRVSITQVHTASHLSGEAGGAKKLAPVASPLEKEIRSSLMAIAEEQGLDGHRSCLTKFSELLLLNGVVSTQQMGVALDLVESLFDPDLDDPEDLEETNRSVHNWLEESEHSGVNSDDGMSTPSHAAMSAGSSFAADRTPPPMMTRGQLATIVSGVPAADELFPTPKEAAAARRLPTFQEEGGGSPAAVRTRPDPASAKPQDLFPSPPATPSGGANGVTTAAVDTRAAAQQSTAGSRFRPPLMRRAEDSYQAAPDSFVSIMSTDEPAGPVSREDSAGAGAPGTPPGKPPAAGPGGPAAVKRSSRGPEDAGALTPQRSDRSDILTQLLSPKSAAANGESPFRNDSPDNLVPESPARNLAAMLRSTLRNPGPAGASLREAFSQGSQQQQPQPQEQNGEDWQNSNKRRSVEGLAEA